MRNLEFKPDTIKPEHYGKTNSRSDIKQIVALSQFYLAGTACFWTKLNSQLWDKLKYLGTAALGPHPKFHPETKANCRSSPKKIVSRSKNGRRKVGTAINLCHRPCYQSVPSTSSHGMGRTMLLVKAQGLHFDPLKMSKICHLVSSSYVFFFLPVFSSVRPAYKL